MPQNLLLSFLFHISVIIIALVSFPFIAKKPIDIPPLVSVELIQITDQTNIPFAPKAEKIIEKVKKEQEKLVSEQAPPKKVKKEKPDSIPLPDQEIEKIKEIEKEKQNPKIDDNKVKQVSEFEKKELFDPNNIAALIDKSKENFAEKVKEITNGIGVPVVYDGVGKKTFDGSIDCLKVRGMMVSFGNASGPIEPCNVGKSLAPKGLYLTRPSIAHYTTTREELDEAAKKVFEMFISKKFRLDIFKKYSLNEIVKAHQDLEARKILGPAVIIP